ncbi:1,4-dihydroxy-2-naphthoate polyprenyltransferase [Catalinimonas niigatensis]|uniref:1,4-dihydroxy-2-naphthoate polyprenyltransferase n=1 Tax=Catalinimonas niigatensis TaxID=1397264 RepID=UPI002666BDF2|nr:1,4-dihydroxy-2-naphthoate polyprenyltransferase [Catalinimonas niigatensis]WPP53622.1 1,4-dihydroxy-2-naphthoate polyprenyltransferase [Catalinimonas niigatensis]
MNKFQAWIMAARPRTLPLALASIGMGAFLAASADLFSWQVLLLSALTTIFLQVLSNLANDYGDSIHGADSADREGPTRAVQAGYISPKAMKQAMIIFGILSFASGLWLLLAALPGNQLLLFLFLLLGIAAIFAAITYTSGSKPYGYAGLGDLSVLLFFGIVGVLGSYYLHAQQLSWDHLLPALSCGLFSTAVLNVNNIRDIRTDEMAGKRSIPVRLGRSRAVTYHWMLLFSGILCSVCYVIVNFESWWQFLFVISLPLLIKNGRAVQHKKTSAALDPYLKQMALTTLLYVLTFGIGQLLV